MGLTLVVPSKYKNHTANQQDPRNRFRKLNNIELVDSINRDGPDTSIYVIYNKKPKSSVQIQF